MQQLLHHAIDAITHEQDCCQGLLAGGGNLIETHASVTNIDHPELSLTDFCKQQAWVGVYLAVDQQPDLDRIHRLAALARGDRGHSPLCFLLLESSQKGRVEAHLFADAVCTIALPLTMQEDGDLYHGVENR